jgi:hypothetical protein
VSLFDDETLREAGLSGGATEWLVLPMENSPSPRIGLSEVLALSETGADAMFAAMGRETEDPPRSISRSAELLESIDMVGGIRVCVCLGDDDLCADLSSVDEGEFPRRRLSALEKLHFLTGVLTGCSLRGLCELKDEIASSERAADTGTGRTSRRDDCCKSSCFKICSVVRGEAGTEGAASWVTSSGEWPC